MTALALLRPQSQSYKLFHLFLFPSIYLKMRKKPSALANIYHKILRNEGLSHHPHSSNFTSEAYIVTEWKIGIRGELIRVSFKQIA